MSIDIGLDIAQSLTAITMLFRDLEDEALHRYADKDIPGGQALTYLGPVANMEAYNYRQLSELMGRTCVKGGLDDPDTDDAPPLLVLAGWTEVIRDHRGMEPETRRARITREADFIRFSIDWMLAENADGVPNFMPVDELARDLGRVRSRLENVLKAGERDDRIRAECESCPPSPRLAVKHGTEDDHSDDSWFCPNCRQPYDIAGVASCWRQMLVKRGDAPEWLTIRDAAIAITRPISTLRSWTLPLLDGFGNPKTDREGNPIPPKVTAEKREDGLTWVRWDEVRAVEDTTARRRRARKIVASSR